MDDTACINTDENHIKDDDELMEECRVMFKRMAADAIRANLPLLDTKEGRALFEEQMYSIFLQLLAYVKVNNKLARKQRQRHGIENAMAAGVHFGRHQRYNAHDYIEVYRREAHGELTQKQTIEIIGSSPYVYRRMKKELIEEGIL
ncbi:MAG: hypothetical protein IKS17_01175 [Firmicutes bacterium]|nr:hypothetical protein [Bacillota bacterium]